MSRAGASGVRFGAWLEPSRVRAAAHRSNPDKASRAVVSRLVPPDAARVVLWWFSANSTGFLVSTEKKSKNRVNLINLNSTSGDKKKRKIISL